MIVSHDLLLSKLQGLQTQINNITIDTGLTGNTTINGVAPGLRTDGFFIRLSRNVNRNFASGTISSILSTYDLQRDLLLSANTDLSLWQLNGGALVFPAITGYTSYSIDIRLYGSWSAGMGQVRELGIELFRQNQQNVAVGRGLFTVGDALDSKSIIFDSYTMDLTDPFIDGGVHFRINNNTGFTMQTTRIDVIIKGVKYSPDLINNPSP